MSDLVRFGVAIERPLLEAFDAHLARRDYVNRSEAIRDMIRADLARAAWERGDVVVATISLLFDRRVKDLGARLDEIQHAASEQILSTTHVHLDEEHCLEVVLARGPASDVKRLADRLIGSRGVLSGEVTAMAIVGRARTERSAEVDVGRDDPPAPIEPATRPADCG